MHQRIPASLPVCLAAFLLTLLAPAPVAAQIYESVGIRAQGMAGAFVAVANDATATWWNPAGLAAGALFNAVLEYETQRDPRTERDAAGGAVPSWRLAARGVALAYPALGLSYYRFHLSEIQAADPTAAAAAGRQDQRPAGVGLRSLAVSQFGATVGQSLGNHLVIATTFKLVRGTLATGTSSATEASLDRAAALEGDAETHTGLDAGALVLVGRARFGLTVRNLRAPAFSAGDLRVTLPRQARLGAAVTALADRLTIALDADVTITPTAVGDVRHLASGAEAWLLRRRLGLRGGVSMNTVGERRPSASGGFSAAITPGTYVEGEATWGADPGRQGWGVALRVTF